MDIIKRIQDGLAALSPSAYDHIRADWPYEVDAIHDGEGGSIDASEHGPLQHILKDIEDVNGQLTAGERVKDETGSTISGALADAIEQRYEADEPLTAEQCDKLVAYVSANSQRIWETAIEPLLDEIDAAADLG